MLIYSEVAPVTEPENSFAVKHTTYVGRAPHEAFFTPDGQEVWITIRGESQRSSGSRRPNLRVMRLARRSSTRLVPSGKSSSLRPQQLGAISSFVRAQRALRDNSFRFKPQGTNLWKHL
jgi:hypothetical protein